MSALIYSSSFATVCTPVNSTAVVSEACSTNCTPVAAKTQSASTACDFKLATSPRGTVSTFVARTKTRVSGTYGSHGTACNAGSSHLIYESSPACVGTQGYSCDYSNNVSAESIGGTSNITGGAVTAFAGISLIPGDMWVRATGVEASSVTDYFSSLAEASYEASAGSHAAVLRTKKTTTFGNLDQDVLLSGLFIPDSYVSSLGAICRRKTLISTTCASESGVGTSLGVHSNMKIRITVNTIPQAGTSAFSGSWVYDVSATDGSVVWSGNGFAQNLSCTQSVSSWTNNANEIWSTSEEGTLNTLPLVLPEDVSIGRPQSVLMDITVLINTPCEGDVNLDGVFDAQDFLSYFNDYFQNSPQADFNLDGVVNISDLFDYINYFTNVGCN